MATSDEMRDVIETEWPEMAAKLLPPKIRHNARGKETPAVGSLFWGARVSAGRDACVEGAPAGQLNHRTGFRPRCCAWNEWDERGLTAVQHPSDDGGGRAPTRGIPRVYSSFEVSSPELCGRDTEGTPGRSWRCRGCGPLRHCEPLARKKS